jgi:hypothetical protein
MKIERILLVFRDGRKIMTNPKCLFGNEEYLFAEFIFPETNEVFWLSKTKGQGAVYIEAAQ